MWGGFSLKKWEIATNPVVTDDSKVQLGFLNLAQWTFHIDLFIDR